MCGFEVRILPNCLSFNESFTPIEGTWILQDSQTMEKTGYVFLHVSKKELIYQK
jgi:hypothetical protein